MVEELLRKHILRQEHTRVCLRCDNDFPSKGPHNRLCTKCRSELNYNALPESHSPSHSYKPRKYFKQV